MSKVFGAHFSQLQTAFPGASWSEGNAGFVVHVPGMPTEPPGGWNMAATGVWFVAPENYPQAAPDCFFADRGLRLAAGTQPTNTSVDNPQLGSPLLWFSWHVARWLPNRDNLVTYVNVIRERLRQAQ